MVHHHPLRDFDLAVVAESVRGRRLEEEEGLARGRVVELLDVGSVVATDGDTLVGAKMSEQGEGRGEEGEKASVPSFRE